MYDSIKDLVAGLTLATCRTRVEECTVVTGMLKSREGWAGAHGSPVCVSVRKSKGQPWTAEGTGDRHAEAVPKMPRQTASFPFHSIGEFQACW